MDWGNTRVVVTGGAGFLGRVVCEKLRQRGCTNIGVPRRQEFDLTTEIGVRRMYDQFEPDVVLHLAAEVGGIGANRKHPGRFFYANAAMGLHLIEEARIRGSSQVRAGGNGLCLSEVHTGAVSGERTSGTGSLRRPMLPTESRRRHCS